MIRKNAILLCDQCQGQNYPNPGDDNYLITCPKCGEYEITGTYSSCTKDDKQRDILSVMVRRYWENTGKRYSLNTVNNNELPNRYNSYTLNDKEVNTLMSLGSKTKPGKILVINEHSLFMAPTIEQEEFCFILDHLENEGLIEREVMASGGTYAEDIPSISILHDGIPYLLTFSGWEEFNNAGSKINTKSCFIAMSFREEEKEAEEDYKVVIKPLLEEMGLNPILIKDVEHNEDVVFKILYELERCRFVIADVRGERPSVYYEAGYARALGREVIWLCKKGDETKMHFDTRNLNHIIWGNRDELKEKLRSRIQGTILI
jgi:hypothetical protein